VADELVEEAGADHREDAIHGLALEFSLDVAKDLPALGLHVGASGGCTAPAAETLIPPAEGIAFPMGTIDTFVTYGAPANLIETVNTMGLPIYARQIARQDGSAIDVKTEASPLPANKRPRLAVKILTSN
jgi:hypothetical protein